MIIDLVSWFRLHSARSVL